MRSKIGTGAAAALLMLAGCGGGDANSPTAEENAELNNAAAMLDEEDASPDSLTVQDPALGNGDAPTAEAGDVLVTDEAATAAAANAASATNGQ
jgi:hypothetical protein